MNNKKIEKIKAKERSFVMKLTKADIVDILKKCNYTLDENVYSEEDGKHLPSIERCYNPEKQEYQLFIRCKHTDKVIDKMYNSLLSTFPILSSGTFNPCSAVILVSDYDFTEICTAPHNENSQEIFARYMYEKFGEYYRIKYNQTVRKEIKKSKDEEQTK